LRAIDELVAWGDGLPLSHFWVPAAALWWLAVFYVGFAIWSAAPHRRPGWRVSWSAAALWLALAAAGLWVQRRPSEQLECAFLSVGHGCCVVLHLPDGGTMLYDAGKLGSPSGSAHMIAQYLWSRGITRLDAVLISHADVDHFNALPQLAERIDIDAVYLAPRMAQDMARGDDRSLDVLRAALDKHGIAVRTLAQGDELDRGECRLRVLHPRPEGERGSDNANSLVLLVECHGRRLLLPGDLEQGGVARLLVQPAQDCDVLLAPHHGSSHSNPPGFAKHFTPEWVVVSGGMTQTSPEVAESFVAAGADVLHTARHNAVRVRVGEDGTLDVAPFRP
jgi:competence protein ComEC